MSFEDVNENNNSRFENTITRTISDRAVQDLKDHKAPGIYQVPVEILKYIGKSNHDKLFQLICKIYDTVVTTAQTMYYRRILSISWIDRVTKNKVLIRITEEWN